MIIPLLSIQIVQCSVTFAAQGTYIPSEQANKLTAACMHRSTRCSLDDGGSQCASNSLGRRRRRKRAKHTEKRSLHSMARQGSWPAEEARGRNGLPTKSNCPGAGMKFLCCVPSGNLPPSLCLSLSLCRCILMENASFVLIRASLFSILSFWSTSVPFVG